jgi:hypothetical protein
MQGNVAVQGSFLRIAVRFRKELRIRYKYASLGRQFYILECFPPLHGSVCLRMAFSSWEGREFRS